MTVPPPQLPADQAVAAPANPGPVDDDARLVVRSMGVGHDRLARHLHRAAHGGDGRCTACDSDALDVLVGLVEHTDLAKSEVTYLPPTQPPRGWHKTAGPPADATGRYVSKKGLVVIMAANRQSDGHRWLHLSVSRRDRKLPTWEQMVEVKVLFLGAATEGYMVLPPESRYVNLNPGVLHIWSCLEQPGGVLPDFTQGTGSI